MSGIKDYSTTPANNNASPPNGFPEGMSPASLNDGMRQVMADIRSWYEDPAWINYGDALTYSSGTVFLVPGNLTARYAVGRRIRAIGTTPFTIEGTITTSSFSSPNTTVTVVWDSGSMNNTLSNVLINMVQASFGSEFTGTLTVKGNSSTGGGFTLGEDTDNGTNTVTLRAPDSIASNVSFKLPSADGIAGAFLQTDGSGNLSFSSNIVSALSGKILSGLTLSNNVSDATNDIDIASGACVSDDGTTVITNSAITKRLDAAWAVGSGNGGLDTGTIANTTYYVWSIYRPDTGVSDVLFSASKTSPTMPTNYTKKKRIGSFIRSGGTILAFTQREKFFQYKDFVADISAANPGTSAVLRTLTVPPSTIALINITNQNGSSAGGVGNYVLVTSPDQTDAAPSGSNCTLSNAPDVNASIACARIEVPTDSSSRIRTRNSSSGASDTLRVSTIGYIDWEI